MTKYFNKILIFMLVYSTTFSQTMRYKELGSGKVKVTKNLSYQSNESTTKKKYFLFDFYEAQSNSVIKKPLIIWLHGGGFKYGNKNAKEIKIWGNEFANNGYVVAALNYRLSKKHPVSKFKDLVAACYANVDDVKSAISYFKINADKFNIDTNKIILAGNSAGAVIALQSVYSNAGDFKNVIDSNKIIADTKNYNPYNIVAVINFWGALFNDDWLKRANVPIVSVCGAKDKIVPINTKGVAFFGSLAIHKKADSLHIRNDIKIYKDYGHELQKHFNPFFRSKKTKQRWKNAADFTLTFLNKTFN